MVGGGDDDPLVVELVEDDGTSAGASGGPTGSSRGGAPGSGPAGRRWGPRARWWGAAALAALAVVGLVTAAVDRRAEADRRARLAELSWVLPSLASPLEEAWRATASELLAVTPEVVVVRDGAVLRGLDPTDGTTVWDAGVAVDESCSWSGPNAFEPPDASSDGALVMCLGLTLDERGAPISRLRGVDALTGAALGVVDVPFGSTIAAYPSPSDVILSGYEGGGDQVVERRDVRTGATLWRHVEPARPEDLRGSALLVTLSATTVAIGGPAPVVLDLATGEPTSAEAAVPVETRWPLADGDVLVWAANRAKPGGSSRVEDDDASVRFRFDGVPILPVWQDGRGAAFCAREWSGTTGPGVLVALDARTGERLWGSADSGAAQSLLQLDGHLLRTSSDAVLMDVRSGRTLWRHPVDPSTHTASPVTDGDVVVLPVRADDALDLVALSLATGGERWRMVAPAGLHAVGSTAVRGLVLAVTDDGVVAYRAD